MRSIAIIICLIPLLLSAQKSGLITYDLTMKIDLGDRANRMPKEILDRIPKERNALKELYFNEDVSFFKDGEMAKSDDSEIEGSGRGRRIRMRFLGGSGEQQTYKQFSSNEMIDKKDLMGKAFIIKDELPEYKWKVTGAKKQILDYLVMEAKTTIDDTISVTAWFSPQIPISNGPTIFHGLPGMILEIDQDNGQLTLVANKVDLTVSIEDQIEKPSKGKEVTQEEFREIRTEKMEEMRAQRGGNGRLRITRRGGQ